MINKVLAIIPAYNAGELPAKVALGLKNALPDATILGIDDGSTDETRMVLRSVCDKVLELDVNRGKGVVLREGFQFAIDRGADAVLTIDADGQHDPAFAPAMIKALDNADIVIGSRQIGGKAVPWHRRIANLTSSAITRAIAKVHISDSQSGYRAMRIELLKNVHAVGNRYEFEQDFLFRAARQGYRFAEVPISTVYGAPSHFRAIVDAYRVVSVLWRHKAGIFQKTPKPASR